MKQKALKVCISPTSKVMRVEKDTTARGRADNTTAFIIISLLQRELFNVGAVVDVTLKYQGVT